MKITVQNFEIHAPDSPYSPPYIYVYRTGLSQHSPLSIPEARSLAETIRAMADQAEYMRRQHEYEQQAAANRDRKENA